MARGRYPEIRESVCVIHPLLRRGGAASGDRCASAELEEAEGLARAFGLEIAASAILPIRLKRAGSFFGSGQIERIGAMAEEGRSDLIVINGSLSAVQQRNLETRWQRKVLDRTALILEIFGARARTHEARLQVDLAHLAYQRSRLVRSWTHLERQRGGAGFMGGPGETQGEADRRQIAERMTRIRGRLQSVRKRRALHRASRRRSAFPTVALVGYTNAGKSTLFNRLTRSDIPARGRLFDTLDPTTRALSLPGGQRVLVSDTVGFISDLPPNLIEAFRATLEEIEEASLIVHVRDLSHPEREAQKRDVEGVLDSLGVRSSLGKRGEAVPMIEFLNKMDRLSPEARRAVGSRERWGGVAGASLSALTGEGLEKGLDLILRYLPEACAPSLNARS